MKHLLKDVYFSIAFDETANVFFVKWYKGCEHISTEEFQERLHRFVEHIKTHTAKGFYVDSTEGHVILTPSVQEWHDKEIVPAYARYGLRRIAFAVPADLFAEISLQQTFEEQQASNLLEARFFPNVEEARAWVCKAE